MSGKYPVRHVRGFCLKWNQARRGLLGGTLAWADEAHTEVRDTTLTEAMAIQDARARAKALQEEVIHGMEVPGCKFIPPATTSYRAPWAAMDEMFAPMMTRACHWPRGSTGRVRATPVRRREAMAC